MAPTNSLIRDHPVAPSSSPSASARVLTTDIHWANVVLTPVWNLINCCTRTSSAELEGAFSRCFRKTTLFLQNAQLSTCYMAMWSLTSPIMTSSTVSPISQICWEGIKGRDLISLITFRRKLRFKTMIFKLQNLDFQLQESILVPPVGAERATDALGHPYRSY